MVALVSRASSWRAISSRQPVAMTAPIKQGKTEIPATIGPTVGPSNTPVAHAPMVPHMVPPITTPGMQSRLKQQANSAVHSPIPV